MAERLRRTPPLDSFGFAVEAACVEQESLAILPIGATVALTPLPSTSRTHPDRRDLQVVLGSAPERISVQSSRPARRPANWVRKLTALHATLTPALEQAGCALLPGVSPIAPWPATDGASPACLRAGLRLDLPFDRAGDFGKLISAVRLVLPLIPAICAATPFRDGRNTGHRSARLRACLDLYDAFPERVGGFIPEAVFEQADHDREVLGPIAQAAARLDRAALPDLQSLDWRAATTAFEPNVVSIHAIDAQENAAADMAVLEFILAVLKAQLAGRWVSNYLQRAWSTDDLMAIMTITIKEGCQAVLTNKDYLLMFGLMKQEDVPAARLLQHLFVELYGELGENARGHIGMIIEHGDLATRILARAGKRPGIERLRSVYQQLAASRMGVAFR